MIEHSSDGAAGLVLNRPSEVDAVGHFAAWDLFVAHPRVVFVGGPVQPNGVLALGRCRTPGEAPKGFRPVSGAIGLVDLDVEPHAMGVDVIRLFAGHSGWGAEQLEGELEEHAWHVVDTAPEDALTETPEDLWRYVLHRQGGDLRDLSYHPPDLKLN